MWRKRFLVCRGEGVSCPEGQKSSTYVYVCVCVCIYHTYIIRYLPSRNVHRENIICIYIYAYMLLLYRFAAQVHNSQNRKQRCSSDSEGTKVQKKSIEALKAEGPKYQCENCSA